MLMYRLAYIVFVFAAVLLAQLEFAGAQGVPENVTVDSVLAIAKEKAETAEYNRNLVLETAFGCGDRWRTQSIN